MRDLEGRVVVVTGAGSGIGCATAEAFAAEGARVHVVDRDAARVEAVVAAITAAGRVARGHVVDVSDPEAVDALAARVLDAEGRVDVLHNNAGIALVRPFEEMSRAEWERILSVNLWGVIYGCQAFLPAMLARGDGVIVNTASLLGLMGKAHGTAYVATKFAVVGLSESLHLEVAPRGVTVMALCPGLIATRIVEDGEISVPDDPTGKRTRRAFARHGAAPEVVARAVVDGVRRRRALVLTPFSARVIAAVRRLSPRLQRWLLDRLG